MCMTLGEAHNIWNKTKTQHSKQEAPHGFSGKGSAKTCRSGEVCPPELPVMKTLCSELPRGTRQPHCLLEMLIWVNFNSFDSKSARM